MRTRKKRFIPYERLGTGGASSKPGAFIPTNRSEPEANEQLERKIILSNIRVVLCRPVNSRNVGAAARAMKNFGLRELYVTGRRKILSPARWMAKGGADILAGLRQVGAVEEAVADCGFVAGTSARIGRERSRRFLKLHGAAQRIAAASVNNRVAVLFGNEESGLSNEEAEVCDALVNIPANPACSSINLAQAVAIVCHSLYALSLGPKMPAPAPRLATAAEMSALIEHTHGILRRVDFVVPGNPRRTLGKLRMVASKVRLSSSDVDLLRGVLHRVELCLDRPEIQKR